MKKSLILFLMLFAILIASAQGRTYPTAHNNSNPQAQPESLTNVDLTGQFIYLGSGYNIYRMQKSSPYHVSSISDISAYTSTTCTGDFDDNGILYLLRSWESDSRLYSYDIQSGQFVNIGLLHGADIGSFGAAGTLSFYNGKMYSIFSMSPWDYSAAAVFEINLSTGLCTRISNNTFPGFYTSLAIDKNGVFYGIDAVEGGYGNLYIIDPIAGTRTLVGPTGLDTWGYCDGDFDAQTNQLYVSLWSVGTMIMNTNNATHSVISPFSTDYCAVGSTSTGVPVPFGYVWVILAFSIIAGTLIIRRLFF